MAAPSASDTVVVITGGDPVDRTHLDAVPDGARVIAADSGVDHAVLLDLPITLVIGDLDSVSPAGLAAARAEGADVEQHPAAKDATDLELALDAALVLAPRHIHVVGGHGGRLDHLLANVALLARPDLTDVEVTARMGAARVAVVRSRATLHGPVGDLVTLLPMHGPADGVTTTGLLYPLTGETLLPGSSRGVSNELLHDPATVSLTAGVLVTIQPGASGSHHQETPR